MDYFEEYRALKREYPDSLLLVLMGNLYETFCEDAEAVSKTCGARLHMRREGALAGLSKTYIEMHRQRLVAAGYQVVFAEEVGGKFRVAEPHAAK